MLANKKGLWLVAIILGLGIITPKSSTAHGVISKFRGRGAPVVEAHYTDKEPMSYAKVTVHAPQREAPFQSGYTDANGHFAFVPDEVGKWNVIFADGMGHRSELELTVETLPSLTTDEAGSSLAPPEMEKSSPVSTSTNPFWQLPLHIRTLIGVCLIFGVAGFFVLCRFRGKSRRGG